MAKVEFLLVPIQDEEASRIQEIESNIYEYCLLVEEIKEKNKMYTTYDFYSNHIVKDIAISDYLFGDIEGVSEDVKNYLLGIISEVCTSELNTIDVIDLLNSEKTHKYKALIGLSKNTFIKNDALYISNKKEYLNPIRYYILNSEDIGEFYILMKEAYPNLHFNDRVSDTIRIFKPICNHIEELNRHLSALNDDGKNIYVNCNNNSDEFYKVFNSKHNIIVSGRGANEGLEKYKCEFEDINGRLEDIRCNPHTKLYAKHSDYRIYFNFGRNDIASGKILVGHIGKHWNK